MILIAKVCSSIFNDTIISLYPLKDVIETKMQKEDVYYPEHIAVWKIKFIIIIVIVTIFSFSSIDVNACVVQVNSTTLVGNTLLIAKFSQ